MHTAKQEEDVRELLFYCGNFQEDKMFSQNTCQRCVGFKASTRQQENPLKGSFKKLCNVCRSKASQEPDEAKEGLHDMFESFITFTCDYGAIIGCLFGAWIVYASLHRLPPAPVDVVAALKKPVIVTLAQR